MPSADSGGGDDTAGDTASDTDTAEPPPAERYEGTYTAGDVGPTPGDFAGLVGAAGDLDGDHRADLLLGAPYGEGEAEEAGLVWLFTGGGAP